MNRESAFPSQHLYSDEESWKNEGMTLRDYFAAKAMQGWFASYPHDADPAYAVRGVKDVAALAYDAADAMLEARK